MQSVTVIKHRYVIQDILLGFIPTLVVPPMHSFLLQAAEEALDYGIVPAVAFAAHARHHATVSEALLIFMACILASPIGMVQ